MSVSTVGAKLATIQEDITGLTKAYAHDELPGDLHTSELPAILNFPGPADYTIISHGFVQEIREWRMQLLVEPVARDVDPGRAGGTLEPFFRRVFEEFLDSLQLEALSNVVVAAISGDSGWSVIEWGGKEYIGAEFTLEVIEKWTVTDYGS